MKINNKYKKISLVSIVLVIILGSSYIVYEKNVLPGFRRDLPHCLIFRDGTASVEVHYSDLFYNQTYYTDQLRINTSSSTKTESILYVLGFSPFVDSIDSIVNADTTMGPKYTKTLFNGRNVALAHNRDGTESKDVFYQIPLGNRILALSYNPLNLSAGEREMADKMLGSIKFKEVKEDVKPAQVESCKEFGNFFLD